MAPLLKGKGDCIKKLIHASGRGPQDGFQRGWGTRGFAFCSQWRPPAHLSAPWARGFKTQGRVCKPDYQLVQRPEDVGRSRAEVAGFWGSEPLFIEHASPWRNGCRESFNGKLLDECIEW